MVGALVLVEAGAPNEFVLSDADGREHIATRVPPAAMDLPAGFVKTGTIRATVSFASGVVRAPARPATLTALWTKCPACGVSLLAKNLARHLRRAHP